MKYQPRQPIDRCTTPRPGARSPSDRDRRGWLRRLGNNVVERNLDTATQGLVRQEKYASVLVVSFRIARELEEPLCNLERSIAMLDRLAEREPGIRQVADSLRRDRQAILNILERLGEIAPPATVDA